MRLRTCALTALFGLTVVGGIARAASSDMCDDPPCTKRQIEAYQRRVGKHVMRAQSARFEASARGESKKAERYDRELKRAQKRWGDAKRALQTASE